MTLGFKKEIRNPDFSSDILEDGLSILNEILISEE